MGETIRALAKPELLRWARESAGLRSDVAAQKAGVAPLQIDEWEAGKGAPTIPQLRGLARAYKRPLAVFFLPEPPGDFQAIRDFRRLPESDRGDFSPELRAEIRRARWRREIAIELAEELEEPFAEFGLSAHASADPEALAVEIRKALRVSMKEQQSWRTYRRALQEWTRRLEDQGLLVFQTSGVDVSEMRGFSITADVAPVVVVNGSDFETARVFTLLHEFVHVMLRVGGVCDPRAAQIGGDQLEAFCNRVAGAALVPKVELLRHELVWHHTDPEAWEDRHLAKLARVFRVSREVVLRRLLTFGKATPELYRRKRRQYRDEAERAKERERSGGPEVHQIIVRNAGKPLTALVLDAYRLGSIGATDVSDFLGTRLKHLPAIEGEIAGYWARR